MGTARRKNPHAAALGRMSKGVPKNYTPEELAKRTARLVEARAKLARMVAEAKKKRLQECKIAPKAPTGARASSPG